MWPTSYWAARYWVPRYWERPGAVVTTLFRLPLLGAG